MSYYSLQGHNEFVLCLGYKADIIKQYFLSHGRQATADCVGFNDDIQVLGACQQDWRVTLADTGLKSDLRWVSSELGTPALVREVAALRCGLDHTTWFDDGVQRCADLLGIASDNAPIGNDPLPFDHTRAHKLYQALLGQVPELIEGNHLLLVPSGALTQLPLQVLVTAPPTTNDHKSIAWLARQHALTTLPAVSSLRALRRVAGSSRASKSMIGFGNPLLDGYQADPRYGGYYKKQAELARAQIGCASRGLERTASLRGLRRSPLPLAQRSEGVDIAEVRLQTPLPETADELCAVARDLNADVADIRPRCARDRTRDQNLEQQRHPGPISDRPLRHPWHACRPAFWLDRAGANPHTPRCGYCRRRRLPNRI
jgi:hypothetical protein